MPSRALAFWSRMARSAVVSIRGVVDVVDRAQEDVPVFVGEVGSEEEAVRAE
jgi:hypothetical protein